MMQIAATLTVDVLVIGAGAAGLRAALAAAEAGSQVIVVNKGPVGRSGITLTAAGGIQAPFHPDDSAELYYQDTVRCGYGLADRDLAGVLAEEARSRIEELECYGARLVRDKEGGLVIQQFPGQSQPRGLAVRGGGIGLAGALAQACRANDNIRIMDDFFVTGLIKNTVGAVAGALGLQLRTGKLTLIQARATIMATGGCQWLWQVNDCPIDASGDGVVYAYRAGADVIDMEMILFYPTVIVWPPSLQGAFVHYEFLASEMLDGNVYDAAGIPVLSKPLPVRDEAMRQLARAIKDRRGGEHGGLFWYVGDSPKGQERVRKKLAGAQYEYIKKHGIDPAVDRIETAPGAHYLLGGIHIDTACQSTLPGLFATPECAGNFDGANRLAGNGLTATQVFGARAGMAAHKWAVGCDQGELDRAEVEREQLRIVSRIAGRGAKQSNVANLRRRLRTAVQSYAGVRRNGEDLVKLRRIVGDIMGELAAERVASLEVYNQQLVELLQMEILCETAGLVAGSALLRTESRGHHYRTDYPQADDANWLCHTVAQQSAGEVRFTRKMLRNRNCWQVTPEMD